MPGDGRSVTFKKVGNTTVNLHAISLSVILCNFYLHFYVYHLMPICLSPLSAVRLSIIRNYTLHQTEYNHSPCRSNDWKHALSQHHDIYQNCYCGSAIIEMPSLGIRWRSVGAAEACQRRADSASIYNFIQPASFVRKLLLQRVCDGCETRPYYAVARGST